MERILARGGQARWVLRFVLGNRRRCDSEVAGDAHYSRLKSKGWHALAAGKRKLAHERWVGEEAVSRRRDKLWWSKRQMVIATHDGEVCSGEGRTTGKLGEKRTTVAIAGGEEGQRQSRRCS